MPAPRRFDHDEARRRYAAGESGPVLAAAYGVDPRSMYRVISPRQAETQHAMYRKLYSAECEICGGWCLSIRHSAKAKSNPDGRELCARCRSTEKRERLRFDTNGALIAVRCINLECANGERWQAPDQFSRGKYFRDVREGGFHGNCRQCGTQQRNDYRNRNPESRERENRKRREQRRARKAAA